MKIEGYNNISNVFLGAADQLTGLGANKLPEDTYFYHIEIPVEVTRIDKLTGYLVLNRYYAPIKKYTRPFLNTLLLI